MIRRRHVLILVALITATALVTSSSAFSTTAAERGVDVEVAEDRNAYLGVEETPQDTKNETTDLVVTVTNQFPSGTSLTTVAVSINGTTVELSDQSPLNPGESANHTFENVSCSDSARIVASGGGVSVRLERTVDCG